MPGRWESAAFFGAWWNPGAGEGRTRVELAREGQRSLQSAFRKGCHQPYGLEALQVGRWMSRESACRQLVSRSAQRPVEPRVWQEESRGRLRSSGLAREIRWRARHRRAESQVVIGSRARSKKVASRERNHRFGHFIQRAHPTSCERDSSLEQGRKSRSSEAPSGVSRKRETNAEDRSAL